MNAQIQMTLILAGQLIFLSALTLLLHRSSARFSLSPMIFLLGGMITALQFRFYGAVALPPTSGHPYFLASTSILLPSFLAGLLVIYIVNGSLHARYILAGSILTLGLVAVFQSLSAMSQFSLFTFSTFTNPPSALIRLVFASVLILTLDMILLIVVYQGISNWQEKYPSLFASAAALCAALAFDTIMYPVLVNQGASDFVHPLSPNLAETGLSALIICVIVAFYIQRFSRNMPGSAAATPRPSLEIFSSQFQLEQRARFHANLLRTTNRINQLVVRSTSRDDLFRQACELLSRQLDYDLAWIGLRAADRDAIDEIIAKAGPKAGLLNKPGQDPLPSAPGPDPIRTAIRTRQPVIHRIDKKNLQTEGWLHRIFENRLTVFAAFPLRLAENVIGVLGVYSHDPNAFDEEEELSLLQQLADDLAYAMISLEARHQQALLQTSTETMPDGLLITDEAGTIIHANPAITEMLDYDRAEIQGQNICSFLDKKQGFTTINDLLQGFQKSRRTNIEFEIFNRHNRSFFVELTVAEVKTALREPSYFVVNLRDMTHRKDLEHRLLALNRFTTELVQVREPSALFEMVLLAGEELLEADASAIWIGSTPSGNEPQVHAHGFPGALQYQIVEQFLQPEGEKTIFDRPALAVENLANEPLDPAIKDALLELGFHSFILLPVQFQGTPMGVWGIYNRQPHKHDDATLQLGVTAARTLAIALQNASLYQSEHSQRRFAEAIVQATETLNSSLDLDMVLSQILEQTYQVVSCNSVNLMLIEEDHAVVVRQLLSSPSGEIESLTGGPVLPLTTPTLFRMMTTGQPIVIHDTQAEPDWKVLEKTSWIRSYAAAPLQIHQEVIGFLNVNSREPNYFDEQSLHRLQAFASHAAAALHNARLYSDLQQYSLDLEDRVDERTAQLSLAKERIEAILESVPDAVYVLDSSENLLESNQAGSLLLKQVDRANGRLFDTELVNRLKSSQDTDEQIIIDVAGRTYQALSSPLPLPEQQAGIVIVFRDVTRFQELDRMKTQFVSDVSHELRTPLANLSLFLDLLANEGDGQKRTRYQSTLRRETDRLTELIEDLLTISRLEFNRVQFFVKEIDVGQLIQDIVDDRSQMADKRGLQLVFTRPLDLPGALADPRLLSQVVSNILTNALNYTPPGGLIRVDACREQVDGLSWIKISISDNGFGIDPEELHHIFDRFYRGSASRKTSAPGTGLGLAISGEIMERMDGKITVESQVGLGSTFTLWLKGVL
ncbi:MAG: GAF domain-containing protein [Anaerolineales bacterium]|nr:GAF domain-containing protein [Anaerolineales bacterium]